MLINLPAYSAMASAVTTALSNWSAYSLYLNGDGANGQGNTAFLDGSTSALTLTPVGSPLQGPMSPYGNSYGVAFNGTSDYLSAASATGFNMGSGDWTMECRFRTEKPITGNPCLIAIDQNGYAVARVFLTSTTLAFQILTTGQASVVSLSSSFVPVPGRTYHAAAVRYGNVTSLYLDGVLLQSVTASYSIESEPGVTIGALFFSAMQDYFLGTIYDARVVKGSAAYTAAFTPPATPLAAVTGTSLLTCQSNRFIDVSANALAVVAHGAPKVSQVTAIAPVYVPATHGGSGLFSGSNKLTTGSTTAGAVSSGNFTIETWVYCSAVAANSAFLGTLAVNDNSSWWLGLASTGGMFPYFGSYNAVAWSMLSSTAIVLNTWNHLAVVRNGSTTTMYLNGAAVATTTGAISTPSGAALSIGTSGPYGTYFTTGRLAGTRIVKGTAIYTANFVPPTAPPTAVSGTSLLCNFDNAGIIDQTFSNYVATSGTAAASTTQQKVGPASMCFNGSTDYLTLVASTNYQFAGDFTIEFWVFATSTGSGLVLSNSTGAGTDLIEFETNMGTVTFYAGGGGAELQVALGLNAWHHVAATRSGSTVSLYVDGVAGGLAKSVSGTVGSATNALTLGAWPAGAGHFFSGYVDDLKITNGTSRYASNFVPDSTIPDPYLSNVVLLLNMETLIDVKGHSVSAYGSAALTTAKSKFGTQSVYCPSGSDHLGVAASSDFVFSADYTVEAWFYCTALPTNYGEILGNYAFNAADNWGLELSSSGAVQYYPSTGSANLISAPAGTVTAGTWNHVAGVRYGSSVMLFVNGVKLGTPATLTGTLGAATLDLYIGGRSNNPGTSSLYVDEVRITKGIARYTNNFTVPAAAFPTA